MGIFDPDEVITVYSLKQAVEDGVLVEIFKNRWRELSGGKPIVATAHLFENVSLAGLREIWNEFARWKKDVEENRRHRPVSGNALPEEERLFHTKMNGMTVWVIEDAVSCTLMYPEDY
jgi:hypothetical protein